MPCVKVFSKTGNLPRQLPAEKPEWGGFLFDFNPQLRKYDWLVVYDDLPSHGKRLSPMEELACPPQNTVLLTHEPSAVKTHGSDFISQFAAVLTCHEEWAMAHPRKISAHPASPWWYRGDLSYDELCAMASPVKDKIFSTVCSGKRMRHTLHMKRFEFTKRLKALMPEMDWFGHGVSPIKNKSQALDPYRYHLVVENWRCPNYWTEKLADAFLSYTLPFYYGAPNAADYFPQESFIPVDIHDFDGALETIRRAIADKEYEKRLPHIIEARRLVLEEHNFFSLLAREIKKLPSAEILTPKKTIIYGRYALWKKSPWGRIRCIGEKARVRLISFSKANEC